jgi:hypothetical protein
MIGRDQAADSLSSQEIGRIECARVSRRLRPHEPSADFDLVADVNVKQVAVHPQGGPPRNGLLRIARRETVTVDHGGTRVVMRPSGTRGLHRGRDDFRLIDQKAPNFHEAWLVSRK